ncbi:MAG: iron ABC transporter permease [Treponema sp.]|jgi:iron complex transport system permease protein|nr:iron ABC transporter permease [Treponema sp.]
MKNRCKIALGVIASLAALCAGISLGASPISPADTLEVIMFKVFKLPPRAGLDPKIIPIVWNLRFPRSILAFMSGGALSLSGAVFQAVLKNQLASPYILGVSSGASLGAALIILTGFTLPFLGAFTLPAAGFLGGLLAVFFVIGFSSKLDGNFSNNTVILFGMVFSLFISALLTTLCALYREELRNLLFWQMGSFALKGWSYTGLMLPFLILGSLGLFRSAGELDILTFGEEDALTLGVDARKARKKLLTASAILTGGAVALSGAIGFADLIAPHLARRITGSMHKYALPMSFITGGALLTITDLAARTVVSPSELPIGALTAIIGAPFFAWVYFRKR